jgi:hypothetical protein
MESDKSRELSKAREQIQASRARLVKLEKDGLELVFFLKRRDFTCSATLTMAMFVCVSFKVTNIRVAGDAREHNRRIEEEESLRIRKERLEQESKSSSEKFEEVNQFRLCTIDVENLNILMCPFERLSKNGKMLMPKKYHKNYTMYTSFVVVVVVFVEFCQFFFVLFPDAHGSKAFVRFDDRRKKQTHK